MNDLFVSHTNPSHVAAVMTSPKLVGEYVLQIKVQDKAMFLPLSRKQVKGMAAKVGTGEMRIELACSNGLITDKLYDTVYVRVREVTPDSGSVLNILR